MRYYSFNTYLKSRFNARVHRIALNANFGCPNRDGTFSDDGCIFCNERGFAGYTETVLSLKEQIERAILYLRRRFGAEKFIAYFQNGTNTYATVEELKKTYDVIRYFPEIVSISISTRPDCVDENKLDLIETYSRDYEVWLEYGVQSIYDRNLIFLNRNHLLSHTLKAIELTSKRNIKIGLHLIIGLPGEGRKEIMKTAEAISALPVSGVKLHVLHVLKDTKLAEMYSEGKIRLVSKDEYVKFVCDFLERLKKGCVILRLVSDARKDVLIAPQWINRKQDIIRDIEEEFKRRNTSQGEYCKENRSFSI